ncbi:MAG TPA: TraR/DksA C4-type zinc finger protein [Candidatus Acidoferrales bacterium]|nr:TraR/DksA C4-type zinc finger protein [Candidatus Acidoferrales bacterium]
MKKREKVGLASELRKQRQAVYKTVVDAEADLAFIQEDRESEFEERAREERTARLFARLDERGKLEIEAIDAALRRLADDTYGLCDSCGEAISLPRLKALPATPYCIDCARKRETSAPGKDEEAPELPRRGALPADMTLLSDREVENSLREMVRDDGRVDTHELRIVSRHGVVYLDGAVPSEGEHQILRKILTDVAGLQEVVDRLQTNELLWARSDRDKDPIAQEVELRPEPASTEDLVENLEDDLDYNAPAKPTSDEE